MCRIRAGGPRRSKFPGFFQRIIPIDRQAKTATVAPGVVVPVPRPFFGVMGVAPCPRWVASGKVAYRLIGYDDFKTNGIERTRNQERECQNS
jgi:acetamidase/formamidase